MPHLSKTVVFADAKTIAATESVICPVPAWATAAQGFISVGTATGTSPTLDVVIYKGIRTPVAGDTQGLLATDNDYDNYTWLPYAKSVQFTASDRITQFAIVGSGELEFTAAAASLADPSAGGINAGPIGSVWKVTFTVGGTNPSFASVKMAVEFIP